MAPQLQINQGPQDGLLYDNSRSYFTNVGYVRTSNFQMELRDIDCQSAPTLGSTAKFVIPKAADLLGPCDLLIKFKAPAALPNPTLRGNVAGGEQMAVWGWVESLGYAMIEKLTFKVGTHEVETLTGEHLNIINELMRTDASRYGYNQTLKTGNPLARSIVGPGKVDRNDVTVTNYPLADADKHDRVIGYKVGTAASVAKAAKTLCIPLGLFFTKHPSAYFPLAAIAGCNDIQIEVKFRTLKELIVGQVGPTGELDASAGTSDLAQGGVIDTNGAFVYGTTGVQSTTVTDAKLEELSFAGSAIETDGCKLRCHYVHVTGPEATALMNKEHVRLMKLWHGNEVQKSFTAVVAAGASKEFPMSIDLSFLHPVQEIIITIRKVKELGSSTNTVGAWNASGRVKNYFAYQGGGKDPNIESITASTQNVGDSTYEPYLEVKTFKLTLNGQTRHLDGQGLDRDYLMNRLMPMLHSNAKDEFHMVHENSRAGTSSEESFKMMSELFDRKEIYVFPFSLNPEGANPAGAVNFSKVSHAKLDLTALAHNPANSTETECEYQVDVYGVYYNWLAIKDGRALTSFA